MKNVQILSVLVLLFGASQSLFAAGNSYDDRRKKMIDAFTRQLEWDKEEVNLGKNSIYSAAIEEVSLELSEYDFLIQSHCVSEPQSRECEVWKEIRNNCSARMQVIQNLLEMNKSELSKLIELRKKNSTHMQENMDAHLSMQLHQEKRCRERMKEDNFSFSDEQEFDDSFKKARCSICK